MARPNRDALLIQDRSDVVRMGEVKREGENSRLVSRGTGKTQAGDFEQTFGRVDREFALASLQSLEGEIESFRKGQGPLFGPIRDEPDRRIEADDPRDVRRSGLELGGKGRERGALERDLADHVAPALVGRKRFEKSTLSVEDPNPGRGVELVTRKRVKVGVEMANVDAAMGSCLSAVDEDERPLSMGFGGHRFNGIDRS